MTQQLRIRCSFIKLWENVLSVSLCGSTVLCPNHEDEGHLNDGAFSPAGANS